MLSGNSILVQDVHPPVQQLLSTPLKLSLPQQGRPFLFRSVPVVLYKIFPVRFPWKKIIPLELTLMLVLADKLLPEIRFQGIYWISKEAPIIFSVRSLYFNSFIMTICAIF